MMLNSRFGFCCQAIAFVLLLIPMAAIQADEVQNEVSAFTITVDGLFTDGVVGGVVQGEWSDIEPLAFLSPPTPDGTLFQVPVGSPLANSLLYAGIAPGIAVTEPELYLMYDYLPRTDPFFSLGEFIADISFPIMTDIVCEECVREEDITVQFRGAGPPPTLSSDTDSIVIGSLFDVFVAVHLPNGEDLIFDAAQFGMEGVIGFGPSALSEMPHLLIELEVPLLIEAEFLGPSSPAHNGVYSPAPAFWGAGIANDGIDPPASAALFEILPGGTVISDSGFLPSIPEPATWVTLLLGMGAIPLRRRVPGTTATL